LDRQLRIRALKPFIRVISRDRLFRRSNQVLLIFRTDDLGTTYQFNFRTFTLNIHFVKFLVELVKLGGLAHLFFIHEKRRLNLLVSAFPKEIESIRNQCLIKVNAVINQVVPSVTRNFGPFNRKNSH